MKRYIDVEIFNKEEALYHINQPKIIEWADWIDENNKKPYLDYIARVLQQILIERFISEGDQAKQFINIILHFLDEHIQEHTKEVLQTLINKLHEEIYQ